MFTDLVHGESALSLPILARAAAGVLLKTNAVRYDAVAAMPFTIDLAALRIARSAHARLIDMVADALDTLDPDDVRLCGPSSNDLVSGIRERLHLPKAMRDGSKTINVAWGATDLPDTGGFAVFDNRISGDTGGAVSEAPFFMLTDWATVLEVMHMNDYGDARLRFALAAMVRTPGQDTRAVG